MTLNPTLGCWMNVSRTSSMLRPNKQYAVKLLASTVEAWKVTTKNLVLNAQVPTEYQPASLAPYGSPSRAATVQQSLWGFHRSLGGEQVKSLGFRVCC